jgi:hypothetical protein
MKKHRVGAFGARSRSWTTMWTVVFALAATACGGEEQPAPARDAIPDRLVASIPAPGSGTQAPGTYVTSTDSLAVPYLALVVQGSEVLAFVCDGETVGEPIGGATNDAGFDLSSNGVQVTGTLQGDVVTGELTLPGSSPVAFTARPAAEGTTGLYREEATVGGDTVVTWWIQTEGGVKGAQASRNGKRGFQIADPAGFEGANIGENPTGP